MTDPHSPVGVHGIDNPIVDSVHTNEGGPIAVLVGVPGAGKTSVGRALAARLGVAFRDTDADIEAGTGRAISDIFVESGEAEFRSLEAAAVARALHEHAGVLALGGGAVTEVDTRALLDDMPVVWLRVGLAAAAQRAGLSGARPVLMGNIRAQLKGLMDARAAFYSEVATLVLDTDQLTIDESVSAICDGVGLAPDDRHTGASPPAVAHPFGSPASDAPEVGTLDTLAMDTVAVDPVPEEARTADSLAVDAVPEETRTEETRTVERRNV